MDNLTGAAAPEVEAALTVPDDPQAAAFFDVDNTIMVGASMFHFARGLARRKFFTTRDLASFALRQLRFRVGGESHDDIATARESALAFVAGKRVDDIVTIGGEIYDEEMSGKVWSGTLALTRLHLGAGQRVWLVTATPVELASIIADRLGLTGALGTVAESRDGVYTGHLVGSVLHGEAKAEAVRVLAAGGLDLSRCAAYSGSINDLPCVAGQPTSHSQSRLGAAHRARKAAGRSDFHTGRRCSDRRSGRQLVGAGAAAGSATRWRRRVTPEPSGRGTAILRGLLVLSRLVRWASRRGRSSAVSCIVFADGRRPQEFTGLGSIRCH